MSQPGQTQNAQPPEAPPVDVAALQAELARAQEALNKANGANASTGRELAELKRKAAAFDAHTAATQTEAEKAQTAAAESARRAETAERKLAQFDAAAAAGLPATMAARVLGTTPEEMAADAAKLATDWGVAQQGAAGAAEAAQRAQRQTPDRSQGQTGNVMPLNGDPIENSMRAALGLGPIGTPAA